MLFVVLFLVAITSAFVLTIEAMKNGLGKKRWFVAGLLFGPTVWPMMNVKKQMKIRKQAGYNIAFLKA